MMSTTASLDLHLANKWGSLKPAKLSKEIDTDRLREPRPFLIDEPLFSCSSMFSADSFPVNQTYKSQPKKSASNAKELAPNNKQTTPKEQPNNDKQTQINLQPTIDSYIINTIKLNRILNSGLDFDQIECFSNKSKAKERATRKTPVIVNTDKDARHVLRQFITVMSIHTGFEQATASSLEILVDLLESYILSIFKILKNLRNIHQVNLNKPEAKTSLVQKNYYSAHIYTQQALQELGIGTLLDIKNFYLNDIINYHQETYKKVYKLYEQFRARKLAAARGHQQMACLDDNQAQSHIVARTEGEIKVEEFIKENDFLNDESNSILGELLTNLNETHFDEEMNKLLQIIGDDPFSLMSEEFQQNIQKI